MRILHITGAYPPHLGGLEEYVYHLANNQRLLGNDVWVITSKLPDNSFSEENLIRLPVLKNLRGPWGEMPICPTIFGALKKINYEIVHGHTPPRFFSESVAAHRLFARKKRPLILTYHLHNESLVSIKKSLWHIHNRIVMRWFFKSADRIIALTEKYMLFINSTFKIPFKKIEVIPPGVDSAKFNPERYRSENARGNFGTLEENVVVFIGRLLHRKGVEYLIRALPIVLDELHGVSLVIVGDGPLKSELEILSKRLNVDSHTRFVGNLPDKDIPELLSCASVLVLPSLSEGLPLVLLEAMSMKKPVIATRVGGTSDLVIDGQTGILVEKRNALQLATALTSILSDRKLALDIGERGRKLVQRKYSWDVVSRKILKLYEDTLTTYRN